MINTKKDAIEYFDHNPHSEGVVFIMIDKCYLISDDEIEDTCDFSICETIDNENVITKEEEQKSRCMSQVKAYKEGIISLDELIHDLENIRPKGKKNDKWKV